LRLVPSYGDGIGPRVVDCTGREVEQTHDALVVDEDLRGGIEASAGTGSTVLEADIVRNREARLQNEVTLLLVAEFTGGCATVVPIAGNLC
jgi:hypothetical protein